MDTRLIAANEYVNLKTRRTNPDGSFDNAGRFYLACQLSCCAVRSPSRAYPYSQMLHGRTAEHVANTYHVSAADVRKIARYLVQ